MAELHPLEAKIIYSMLGRDRVLKISTIPTITSLESWMCLIDKALELNTSREARFFALYELLGPSRHDIDITEVAKVGD